MSDNFPVQKLNLEDATITVMGLGHIGLPTALGLADLGYRVIGADDDAGKVGRIRAGDPIFFEPGLGELLTKHLQSGRFQPVEDVGAAVRSGSIIFICVGTPQKASGQADLGQVEAVARVVARNLNGYKLIVEKSTVPAITARWLRRSILRYMPGRSPVSGGESTSGQALPAPPDFDIASNPEFLREGKALEDFFHPDRIVCGVESERAREILTKLYSPLQRPIVVTDTSTSELIKHAANAFLSMKISFINMVSDLCEKVGADVGGVARGIGLDSRIGPQFLDAGIGYGGYCFPKDIRAFVHLAEEQGVDFSLLREVERINERRVDVFIRKVRRALWNLSGKTLGILGLAFKAGTDDIREAVSLKIIKALLDEGSILRLYDPEAMPNTRHVFPVSMDGLTYCESAYEAARGAQALLIVTEWEEFRQLDLLQVRGLMEVPVLVDGRNLFDPDVVRKAGFEYVSVGREAAEHADLHVKPEADKA
jgi:UDPglucose 6-dehydrogenase